MDCTRNWRLIGGTAALLAAQQAAALTIAAPFMNLENRNVNSLGFATGELLRWGAVSVEPDATAGTVGVAVQAGTGTTRAINFSPSPLNPHFFTRNVADAPELRGNWTLRFTNGSDVATAPVGVPATARQAPFVDSITLSGTGSNPTFSWAPPAGAAVNGYRINIYDKSLVSATNSGQVTNRDLLPGQRSYTVTASDFTVPGYAFTLGKNYSIEISLIQTKDGSTNTGNSNILAIARSYADFRPTTGGAPLVNLPVVLANGSFQFDMAVVPGQTYYIDPDVAVGYDYAIAAGNPNFASVMLPAGIGDGLYDIFGIDGGSGATTLLAHDWRAGDVYSFAAGGVSRFRVGGIEVSAALDPANPTAFVTGLTFTGAGSFTGTQTPIAVAVPEPSTWALWSLGIAAVGWTARRRRGPTAPPA